MRQRTYTAKQDDTDVLEVESTNGREMSGEEVVLAPPQSCGNTTTGDWCSISIQWLRDSGFGEHPDWYPGLSHESTDREIQAELHRQGKVGCPEPCQERRPDMTTTTSTVAPSCTDAEEGSACFDAVMAEIGGIDIKVALDELASTFRKVQERLYHSMKAGCTRPCAALHSQKVIDQRGYMKKPVEDMTMNEMKIYFDGDWDGMVPASTSRFAIPTQDTAEASTTEAVLSDDAAAENESEEALTYESAAEIAAENASSMEPMALQKASPEEIDADTYVASGPDESNNSWLLGPFGRGSTFTTGRDGDGLVGRIVEGSTANRATETAAENASDLEPPAPEEHVAAEGVADAAAERSLPVPEVDAKLAAGEDEPLPYVDEDGVETSPAEEREDASQQAPHDAAWEGTVAGAILEASTNPDATSEADQLKAELEKLKAENDALKQSTELEKLRAENEALKRAAELKAENEALQQEQSNASQPAEEQRSSAADPAEEDGGVGQPADEQGGAVRPAEPAEAAPPAGERGGAGEPAPERGDAVHPVDKQASRTAAHCRCFSSCLRRCLAFCCNFFCLFFRFLLLGLLFCLFFCSVLLGGRCAYFLSLLLFRLLLLILAFRPAFPSLPSSSSCSSLSSSALLFHLSIPPLRGSPRWWIRSPCP
ncbi:unnamed protein product [Prorocentrum cordatum]|uniref:Uncharacterized protein n=1 Tax=Prorocentrum cordatum TaxID=2364126 RepID=A0ABN9YD27_9DINO|nr:unnamed protein product [Polarella glacialis]